MKSILLILVLYTGFITGCYYDKEDILNPGNGTCDTNGVTYNGTVVPLLQASGCLGCHSGGAPSGNISLATYTNVKAAALNGKLFGAINHSPGFSPMPQGGNKMSSCNISKIKAWIDAGSINN